MSRTGNIPRSRLEINLFIDGFLQPEAGIIACRPTIGPEMRLRQCYLDRVLGGGVGLEQRLFQFRAVGVAALGPLDETLGNVLEAHYRPVEHHLGA